MFLARVGAASRSPRVERAHRRTGAQQGKGSDITSKPAAGRPCVLRISSTRRVPRGTWKRVPEALVPVLAPAPAPAPTSAPAPAPRAREAGSEVPQWDPCVTPRSSSSSSSSSDKHETCKSARTLQVLQRLSSVPRHRRAPAQGLLQHQPRQLELARRSLPSVGKEDKAQLCRSSEQRVMTHGAVTSSFRASCHGGSVCVGGGGTCSPSRGCSPRALAAGMKSALALSALLTPTPKHSQRLEQSSPGRELGGAWHTRARARARARGEGGWCGGVLARARSS